MGNLKIQYVMILCQLSYILVKISLHLYNVYKFYSFCIGASFERGTSDDSVKLRWEAALCYQLAL